MLLALACLLPSGLFKSFDVDRLLSLDKLVHLLLFFILSVLWLIPLSKKGPVKHKIQILAFILYVLYGTIIELFQLTMSAGRSFETGDILADALGALLGVLSVNRISRLLPLAKKRLPFVKHWY